MLITKAQSISCYSIYQWISNFILWTSHIYNVPLRDLYLRRFKMGRSCGVSFEVVTDNLVEELNVVPFEFFNGVK